VELSVLDHQQQFSRYAHIRVLLPTGRPGKKDHTLQSKQDITTIHQ
jgi:hypothetical protein